MDSLTRGAASAAPFADPQNARRWFELIHEELQRLPEDVAYDDAMDAILRRADSDGIAWAAEALSDYLSAYASDPAVVLRELAEADHVQEYVEASIAVATGDAERDAPFDMGAWESYLAQWQSGWDGTDASWTGFVEGLRYWAPDGLRAAVDQLLDSAETTGRVEVLAAYGLVAAAQPTVPEPVASPESAITSHAVIASVLKDRPDLAALGEARLEELFTEVMAEFQVTGQPVSG